MRRRGNKFYDVMLKIFAQDQAEKGGRGRDDEDFDEDEDDEDMDDEDFDEDEEEEEEEVCPPGCDPALYDKGASCARSASSRRRCTPTSARAWRRSRRRTTC